MRKDLLHEDNTAVSNIGFHLGRRREGWGLRQDQQRGQKGSC